jgi:hypothetical protein
VAYQRKSPRRLGLIIISAEIAFNRTLPKGFQLGLDLGF